MARGIIDSVPPRSVRSRANASSMPATMRGAETIAICVSGNRCVDAIVCAPDSSTNVPGFRQRAIAAGDADQVGAVRFVALRCARFGHNSCAFPIEVRKRRPNDGVRLQLLAREVACNSSGCVVHRCDFIDRARHALGHRTETSSRAAQGVDQTDAVR